MDPRARRSRARAAVGSALLAAGAALAGCAHAHAATPRTQPVAVTSIAVHSCGGPVPAGTTTVSLPVHGQSRHFRLYVPGSYRADRRLPVVLNLHGTGSTAAHQESATGMDATAGRYGFLVAYPEGAHRSGTGFAWNIPGTPTYAPAGPDDLGYLGQVITMLHQRYCADPARTYAVGFSGGGRLVSQYACQPGHPLAAAAAVGGLRAPSPCPSAPVPVIAIHGTADTQNPYLGHGQPYWTYGVPEAERRWGATDGCAPAPTTTRVATGIELTTYHDCRAGSEVDLYTLSGRGHIWPTPKSGLDTDETVWAFFSAHPRPLTDRALKAG